LKRISPTGDLAFKKVLSSEENKDILSGLINDYFGVVAEDITIINPYSIEICKRYTESGEDINELRYTLRDIAATFKTGDFVSELQIKKTMHFDERLLYYPFKRFCENYGVEGRMKIDKLGKPILYSSLRPVFALNILDYIHYDDEESLRVFELYDPIRGKHFGKELVKIGVFELKKTKIETVNQKHWQDFFAGDVKPDAPDYIKKANEVIDFINLGEEERKVAEALEKARATIQDELAYSFYEGKTEGKEEGIMEGLVRGAKSMLQKGYKPEVVADCMNLPLEQVFKLQPQ
jgi:predicted transposase/invertase (TIGR01784 family)